MEDRTIVLYGGGELEIGRGPGVDGLVFFRRLDRHDRELVVDEFAMDAAAARRAINALYEAAADAERTTGREGQGALDVGGEGEESRELREVYS